MTSMQLWEYKLWFSGEFTTEDQRVEQEAELNRFGADGWELVTVLRRDHGNYIAAFMKRPKSDG